MVAEPGAVLTPRRLGALLVDAAVLGGVKRTGAVLTPRGRLGASLVNAAVLAGVKRLERVDTLGTVLAASERTGEVFAEVERRENADVRPWLSELGSRPSRQASA
jgi:hypothetical protein